MTYTPPRLVTSNPATVTVEPAFPYALPSPGQKIDLVVSGSNRFLDDVRPAWYTTFSWRYSMFGVLCGGAFSPDFTTGGAYFGFGHGGHLAPESWGFTYFDFTTGRWAPYVNGRDALGYEAPQSAVPWKDDTLANPPVYGVVRNPAYTTPLKGQDDMIQLGGQGTNPPGPNADGTWTQMPPPDHTYTLLHAPRREKIGGTAFGIRVVTTAATSAAVSGSRSHKLMFEGANVGRWSFYSTNLGRHVWNQTTLTDTHSAMDEVGNRIFYPINWTTDNRLYYIDLADATWKYIACTNATAAGITSSAHRGCFFDTARNLLVMWNNVAGEVAYVNMNAPTKAWAKANVSGWWPGDSVLYPPTVNGRSTFKARLSKWPASHGGDDCWYGLWGRGPNTPNSNASLPTQQAVEQFLWKLTIPTALTDQWTISQVPISGGITAELDLDWYNAQALHFTRFFFVPWLGCFAWIPRADTNVELIRPPTP